MVAKIVSNIVIHPYAGYTSRSVTYEDGDNRSPPRERGTFVPTRVPREFPRPEVSKPGSSCSRRPASRPVAYSRNRHIVLSPRSSRSPRIVHHVMERLLPDLASRDKEIPADCTRPIICRSLPWWWRLIGVSTNAPTPGSI